MLTYWLFRKKREKKAGDLVSYISWNNFQWPRYCVVWYNYYKVDNMFIYNLTAILI